MRVIYLTAIGAIVGNLIAAIITEIIKASL